MAALAEIKLSFLPLPLPEWEILGYEGCILGLDRFEVWQLVYFFRVGIHHP